MAEFSVRRGDADRLAGFEGQTWRGGAEDGGEDATSNSAGVHLLELQEGLTLLWRGGRSHHNYKRSHSH